MEMSVPFYRSLSIASIVFLCVGLLSGHGLAAQQYAPAFDFEHVLNTYFDDESGLISFRDYRVLFAPEGQFNAQVAVLDADGKIVAVFPFFKDYASKEGIYARAQVQGPADVKLSEPGIYTIVYVVDGKPVTRLPVRLEQTSAGDDPFNPAKTYRFDGYWRTMAFLTLGTYKEEKFPMLNYWLGGKDLPTGANRDKPFVGLYRDGALVAHNRRTMGIIQTGHFKGVRMNLYHPHEAGKEANALPFLLKDWLVDGTYEIRVTRVSDDALLRSFDFRVVDGEFEAHPRSRLGYEPQTDYIAPRVQQKGATYLSLAEALWIQDRQLD